MSERYYKPCLETTGPVVCDGVKVVIIDSRGRSILGVFKGVGGGFIALAPDCTSPPNRFVKIQYVAEIVIVSRCSENGS